jgi:hypothetical protein
MYIHQFHYRIFPLSQMPLDRGFGRTTLEDGVIQHMAGNDDWSYKDFFDFANVINLSERRFRSFCVLAFTS